jgi:hypothetical protein
VIVNSLNALENENFIDDVFSIIEYNVAPIAFEVLLRVKLSKMLYVP